MWQFVPEINPSTVMTNQPGKLHPARILQVVKQRMQLGRYQYVGDRRFSIHPSADHNDSYFFQFFWGNERFGREIDVFFLFSDGFSISTVMKFSDDKIRDAFLHDEATKF